MFIWALNSICICLFCIGVVLQLGVKRMVQVFLYLWPRGEDEAGDVSAGGGCGDGTHPASIQLRGFSPSLRQRGLQH